MKLLNAILMLVLSTLPSANAQERNGVNGQSRELQLLWVNSGFQIGVDTDPQWSWGNRFEEDRSVFVIESPSNYYPPASIEVRYNKRHKLNSFDFAFKKTAYFTIQEIQKKFGATSSFKFSDLIEAQYGELKGYEQTSVIVVQDYPLSSKVFVGLNQENHLIILNASTLPGKMPHLQPVLNRFWSSITFLQSSSLDH